MRFKVPVTIYVEGFMEVSAESSLEAKLLVLENEEPLEGKSINELSNVPCGHSGCGDPKNCATPLGFIDLTISGLQSFEPSDDDVVPRAYRRKRSFNVERKLVENKKERVGKVASKGRHRLNTGGKK